MTPDPNCFVSVAWLLNRPAKPCTNDALSAGERISER